MDLVLQSENVAYDGDDSNVEKVLRQDIKSREQSHNEPQDGERSSVVVTGDVSGETQLSRVPVFSTNHQLRGLLPLRGVQQGGVQV